MKDKMQKLMAFASDKKQVCLKASVIARVNEQSLILETLDFSKGN